MATVAPLLLLPPQLLASSAFFILPAQPLSLIIKIKNRQEKTTIQKTLLDLKHQDSTGGYLLADSQIELSKSLSQKGCAAPILTILSCK
jgi:hypothetical protein